MPKTAAEHYEQWRAPLKLPEGGVSSLADFSKAIEKWAPIRSGHLSNFRGEDRYFDSFCVPKLGRHESVDDFKPLSYFLNRKGHINCGTDTVFLLEEFHILTHFREWFVKQYPDLIAPAPHSTAWLDLAQHHGAPTRLLDVSRNPLVGLFFACWNPDKICDDAEDGVVWIKEAQGSVRQQSVSRVEYLSRLECDAEIQQGIAETYFDLFEPWTFARTTEEVYHLYIPLARNMEVNRRVHAQHGQFVWNTSMKRVGQWFPILVPGKAKKALLVELNNLYVNPFMLFPGDYGQTHQDRLNKWLDEKDFDDVNDPIFEWEWPGADRKNYYHLIPSPKAP